MGFSSAFVFYLHAILSSLISLLKYSGELEIQTCDYQIVSWSDGGVGTSLDDEGTSDEPSSEF